MSVEWAEEGSVALLAPVSRLATLVERARDGDRVAFAELYAEFRPMVHGVLVASVPALEVSDLVQDVFTRAWASLRSLRCTDKVGPWLATIARNRATDFLRERRQPPELPMRGSESPHFVESLALLEAIRGLPNAYRETLALRLVEGMSGPEIAEQTGKSHRSVRVNLHRGMKLLRERLADKETKR